MKIRLSAGRLLILVSLTLASVLTASAQTSALVIDGVTVVDVETGSLRPNSRVVIAESRIAEIGPKARVPAGSTLINAQGKFLIPGLWDMHVHILYRDTTDIFFPMLVANGVLGVRDTGTTEKGFASLPKLREQIARGELIGPRLFAAGRILDGAHPSVPENSIPFSTDAEARQQVRFMKEHGANFIKIYDMPRSSYYAVADEAKKIGIPIAGHVPTQITAFEASNAGQRSFEHLGNILNSCSSLDHATIERRVGEEVKDPMPMGIPNKIAARTRIELETYNKEKCSRLFATLKKNMTWQVPTLVTKRGLNMTTEEMAKRDPRMQYVDREELESWKPENNMYYKFGTPQYFEARKRLYEKELDLVREMHKAGVPFMAGTDIPGSFSYAGFSLHDELQMLVDCGFTPAEALRAATISPAIFVGRGRDLGSVAKGKIADLVLLDADPLANIASTKKINAVIVGGRLLDRTQLDALLDGAKRAAKAKN